MRLIIGLGNPEEKYIKTKHNIGFMVLEKIAKKRGVVFRSEPHYESKFAELGDLENRIKLIEPQTFMNNSGRAVIKCKDYWKVDSEDIWVIHDDVDLEFGKVKIQFGCSSAGHNGIKSIIDKVGESFWRIRVGIGNDLKIPTDDWVLMNFSESDSKKLNEIIDKVADSVIEFLSNKISEETIMVGE